MRQWADNRTAAGVPTPYLDFDAWSTAPDVPGACAKGNKHYACHLRIEMDEQPGLNYWREPRHNVRRFLLRWIHAASLELMDLQALHPFVLVKDGMLHSHMLTCVRTNVTGPSES